MGNMCVRGLDPARASARSTGRFLAALVIALCVLMMGANDAFADVDWKHKGDSSGYLAEVAPYPYTDDGRRGAVAEFLGYNWDSMPQDVKSKILSDGNGTNAFVDLCNNKCKNYVYEIDMGPNDIAEAVSDFWRTIFGYANIWRISCTEYQYNSAKELIDKWLHPSDDSGGGGEQGDITVGNNVYIPFSQGSSNGNIYTLPLRPGNSNSITSINVDTSNVSANEHSLIVVDTYSGTTMKGAKIYNLVEGLIIAKLQNTERYYLINTTNEAKTYTTYYSSKTMYPDSNGDYVFPTATASTHNAAANMISEVTLYSFVYCDGGSTSEPYVPTPDPTPSAPIIQIGDVTIDLSNGPYTINNTTYTAVQDTDNNWTITITNNTTNNYSGDEQASDPTDYTSILNAILAAINSLRSEMTTYSNQINTALTSMSNNLQTAIKNADTSISNHIKSFNQQMHSDIQTLQTNLQNSYNARMDAFAEDLWENLAALDGDIIEELDAVAKYIVEGIQFDSGFSDTDIITWLKKIYARLAGNKGSVPSVDDDPEGWLDGLKKILDELLDVILSGLNVATLASLFEGLKTRFPISIPWDIAAIVNMFAGGAVTPVFDLPLPKGDGTLAMVHVDLHEWDDEMALVRQGELLLFGMALMFNTKWMFDTITTTFRRGD